MSHFGVSVATLLSLVKVKKLGLTVIALHLWLGFNLRILSIIHCAASCPESFQFVRGLHCSERCLICNVFSRWFLLRMFSLALDDVSLTALG